jgi:magnesium-transporting ATPase (P-type)
LGDDLTKVPGQYQEADSGMSGGQHLMKGLAVRRHNLAVQTDTAGRPAAAGRNWCACTPDDVAAAAGMDPAVGLSAAQAADLLAKNGPNSLPEEKPRPGWSRFLGEYRSYMQIILVAAAVVSSTRPAP